MKDHVARLSPVQLQTSRLRRPPAACSTFRPCVAWAVRQTKSSAAVQRRAMVLYMWAWPEVAFAAQHLAVPASLFLGQWRNLVG